MRKQILTHSDERTCLPVCVKYFSVVVGMDIKGSHVPLTSRQQLEAGGFLSNGLS